MKEKELTVENAENDNEHNIYDLLQRLGIRREVYYIYSWLLSAWC